MTWRITTDHLMDEDSSCSRAGHGEDHSRVPLVAAIAGFESEPLPSHDAAGAELPMIPFRLFDDDGELYYEGELHDDEECLNQLAAQSFGEADAGCTRIEVCRDGEWKQEVG